MAQYSWKLESERPICLEDGALVSFVVIGLVEPVGLTDKIIHNLHDKSHAMFVFRTAHLDVLGPRVRERVALVGVHGTEVNSEHLRVIIHCSERQIFDKGGQMSADY